MKKIHEISTYSTYYRKILPVVMRSLDGLHWREAIAVVVLMQGPLPAFAQGYPEACFPPEPPYTALPQADLQEFRAELSSDFERYFREITRYIRCLDVERARALAEGTAITVHYANFLEATTNDENK